MKHTKRLRNAGPAWGYRVLMILDGLLPTCVGNFFLSIGTFIATLLMPEERAYSHQYLAEVTGEKVGIMGVYRHFRTFVQYLMVKLRAGQGHEPTFSWATETQENIDQILRSDKQLLLGTFHLGYSDLIAFKLGDLGRKVSMVRLRFDNSEDVEALARASLENVEIIWANNPQDIIFEMKQGLEKGKSLAVQCDRVNNGGKCESFHFLGKHRLFPVSIYRLAKLFQLPVLFCFAVPENASGEHLVIYPSRLWYPEGEESYHEHYQSVLNMVETILERDPNLWFNFIPLNPVE